MARPKKRIVCARHRVLFERVGHIVLELTSLERAELRAALDGDLWSERDRTLVENLRQCGGVEMLRIALDAVLEGVDPTDALLNRVEA